MGLVYATDVKSNGEFTKKRGDAFKTSDAKDMFDLEDGKQLLEDGIIVMEDALPENVEETRSLSYYELEAQMRRENQAAIDDGKDIGMQKQGAPPNQRADKEEQKAAQKKAE